MKLALITGLVACIAGLTMMAAAEAADTFFMGSWKLSGAAVAPWSDPKQKPDSARAMFSRYRRELVAAARIACDGDLTWLI